MDSAVRDFALRALLISGFAFPAVAQDGMIPAATRRPVIGVALSGGGALGLAHIGVLKWMEENHIPVDRIAGTSMGGIVGAIYATGMSPEEMEAFASNVNWLTTLLAEPTYQELSYRRKQDRRAYEVSSSLGLRHGLSGPNGF